jgi:hypothetical protein
LLAEQNVTPPAVEQAAASRSAPAPITDHSQALEALADYAYGGGLIDQVIRPAAILSEAAARKVLVELLMRDARDGGLWVAESACWRRFDQPWNGRDDAGTARLMGSMQVIYDRPRRYEITVFRATITVEGSAAGWTTEELCDEAFAHAGLTLATCPRADLTPPPARFRMH